MDKPTADEAIKALDVLRQAIVHGISIPTGNSSMATTNGHIWRSFDATSQMWLQVADGDWAAHSSDGWREISYVDAFNWLVCNLRLRYINAIHEMAKYDDTINLVGIAMRIGKTAWGGGWTPECDACKCIRVINGTLLSIDGDVLTEVSVEEAEMFIAHNEIARFRQRLSDLMSIQPDQKPNQKPDYQTTCDKPNSSK